MSEILVVGTLHIYSRTMYKKCSFWAVVGISNILSGGGGGQWRNGEFDKWKRQIRHRHFSPFFAIIRHFSPLVVFEIKHFRH